MRIISISTLRKYWMEHNETEGKLLAWIAFVKKAKWGKPNDVRKQFAKASIVGSNRAVFDICGGNYRLVVKINYEAQIVYIRFIGTHKQYDAIKADKV